MTARASIALVLTVLVALPDAAHASATGSWDAVRELPPGKRIRVVLASDGQPQRGIVVQGRFASATEYHIALLARNGGTRTFPKAEVYQVRVRVPFMKRRVAWLVAGPVGGLLTGLGYYLQGPVYAAFTLGWYFWVPYALLSPIGRTAQAYTADGKSTGSQQPPQPRDTTPAAQTVDGDRGTDGPVR